MKIFLRVYHQVSNSHSRSQQMINVIDSDYDEDDEYNQYEIDEIFSISPTGEECYDIDPNKDEYGGDSEFDQDEIITPGAGTVGSIHSAPADRDEEDGDDDYENETGSRGDLSDLRVKRHMVKFGMHNNNSRAYEEYFMKHNAQGRLLENMNPKLFERLMSEKNQQNYLNELKEMNSCPECIKARSNTGYECKNHGHHHNFTKVLAASLGHQTSKSTRNRR
jgi:hypothetical protein